LVPTKNISYNSRNFGLCVTYGASKSAQYIGFVMLSARSARIDSKTTRNHPIMSAGIVLGPMHHYYWCITETGCWNTVSCLMLLLQRFHPRTVRRKVVSHKQVPIIVAVRDRNPKSEETQTPQVLLRTFRCASRSTMDAKRPC